MSVTIRYVSLEAKDLGFWYRAGKPVLDGVSFGPRLGAVTGVVGPNGAGKSTLLRLLLGTLRPAAGWVRLNGRDVAPMGAGERARRMAYIPQRTSPAFGFTVRECVRMGRLVRAAGAEAATDTALERVGLAAMGGEVFDTLSEGQQQKAILARALAQLDGVKEPVLLADEPASALDPAHTLEAMTLLREVARGGAAVVVVLHDLPMAGRFCDDVLVLGPGGGALGCGASAQVLVPEVLDAAFGVRFVRGEGSLEATLPAGH